MTQWKVSKGTPSFFDLLAHPIIPKDVINASLSTLANEIEKSGNIHMAIAQWNITTFVKIGNTS